jgi:GT2 family glycosyltransferase
MKADIAKNVKFRDATSGEDLDWTIKLARAGFLRTEYQSDESRIHYLYDLGTRQVTESTLAYQRTVTYETQLQNVLVLPTRSALLLVRHRRSFVWGQRDLCEHSL